MNIPEKYLTEKIILIEARVDKKAILKILTQNNQEDPNINYYTELANWANDKQEKTGKIDLTTIELSDRSLIKDGKLANNTKHLGHTLNQLKNLMDQDGLYNTASAKSRLIQKTTLEILAGLSGKKAKLQPIPEPDPTPDPDPDPDPKPEPGPEPVPEETESNSKRDWTAYKAKLLKGPGATSDILDKFYDEYYKIEYAGLKSSEEKDTTGIVAKLQSLDKILIQEFNKLGYNPEVNPFAQFLKILIKLKKENDSTIFDKLTTNNYGAIHNAFIDQHITGNMLGNYSDKTKKTILFCEDLYNYKGLDIVNYLALQKQVLDATKEDTRYSNDPELIVAKLFIQQKITVSADNAIGYKEQVAELLKPETKVVWPSEKNTKMRSWLEISEMFEFIFGVTAKKTLQASDIESIISTATAENIILGMLQHLIGQDSFVRDYQPKVKEIQAWLEKHPYVRNKTAIKTDIEKSKQILSKYTLTSANILDLVKKLLVAYNKINNAKAKAKE